MRTHPRRVAPALAALAAWTLAWSAAAQVNTAPSAPLLLDGEPVRFGPDPGAIGEQNEICETAGTVVSGDTEYEQARLLAGAGDVILLRAGTYSHLRVPSGAAGSPVVVKPYACEAVTAGSASFVGSHAVLAGMRLETTTRSWVIRISSKSDTVRTDIVIRNCTIRGGITEAVRINDNVHRVTISGCDIDGGQVNHALKVQSETGIWHPNAITITNNRFSKLFYATAQEDLIALENHNNVIVSHNHFSANPNGEDFIDVKTGLGVTSILSNEFDAADGVRECLLIHGRSGNNQVVGNHFNADPPWAVGSAGSCGVSVGSGGAIPTAILINNVFDGVLVRLRKSIDVRVDNNSFNDATFHVGLVGGIDVPRNASILGNRFVGGQIQDRSTPEFPYTCSGNTYSGTQGSLDCPD